MSLIQQPPKDVSHPIFWALYTNRSPKSLSNIINRIPATVFNKLSFVGHTPLVYAIYKQRIHAVKTLIKQGADINHAAHPGLTPLIYAAATGDLICCQLLINEPNLLINAVCQKNRTALHWSIGCHHTDCAIKLIEDIRVDINLQDHEGWTPLMHAVFNNNSGVIASLMKRTDIDVHIKNHNNRSAMDIAVIHKKYALIVQISRSLGTIPCFDRDQQCWLNSDSLKTLIHEFSMTYDTYDLLHLITKPIVLLYYTYLHATKPSTANKCSISEISHIEQAIKPCDFPAHDTLTPRSQGDFIATADIQPISELPQRGHRCYSF